MYILGKSGTPSILSEDSALGSNTNYTGRLMKSLFTAGLAATTAACETYRDNAPAMIGGRERTPYEKMLIVRSVSKGDLKNPRTGQYERSINGFAGFHDDNQNGKEDARELYLIVFREGDDRLAYELTASMQNMLNSGRTPVAYIPVPSVPPGVASSASPSGYYPVTKSVRADGKTVWNVNAEYMRLMEQNETPIDPAGTDAIRTNPALKKGGSVTAPSAPSPKKP